MVLLTIALGTVFGAIIGSTISYFTASESENSNGDQQIDAQGTINNNVIVSDTHRNINNEFQQYMMILLLILCLLQIITLTCLIYEKFSCRIQKRINRTSIENV